MEPKTAISDKYYIYSSDAGHEPSENVFVLAPDKPANQFVASLESKVIVLDKAPTATTFTCLNSQDKWATLLKTIDGPSIDCSLKLDPAQSPDKALQSFRFNVEAPWGSTTFDSSRAALESAFGKEATAMLDPSAIFQGEGRMTSVLHCGLLEPVQSLKPTVGQILEYAGRGNEIKYLPSFIPSVTCTLDISNYSGKRNALWLYPGSNFKTILQLHFRLYSTKELQKLFETDLPGLEITEADVVCKIVTLEGSRFVGSDTGVFFTVKCAITFNNARVEMTAGIEINSHGVTITVNSVPGNFNHTIAWIEDVTDLDPAAFLASFGPGTTFQDLDIQGFEINLSNTMTSKDDPILSSVNLELEVASNFGKVDGKRPLFKVFTYWMDHEDGDKWHRYVLGDLWSSYNNSPGRLLHPDYRPWCDQSPYKELTTVINLEDLPGRSEPIAEGCPSQLSGIKVDMTKTRVTFRTKVIHENNSDIIFRLSATYEWETGKSDFSLVPVHRVQYWV